jgi:uncharacterized protein (TIGR01777 family)
MRVIITGGSGLIGSELTANLAQDGHEVTILSRNPEKVSGIADSTRAVAWDGKTDQGWGHLVEGADAIVNLAGENLAGEGFFPSRLTSERKQRIRDSRVFAGEAIVEALQAAEKKPEVLIQSSAVGYYGPHGDEKLDENSPPGDDFFAGWKEWEKVTAPAEDMGVRRIIIRSGVVFTTKKGSALTRLMLPFKLFAGGPFGNGRQYISWIHIADEVGAIRTLIENKVARGVYNLTAPNPVTNAEAGKALAKVMHRPYYLPTPGFALKMAFGEVTSVVLEGQRVIPKRLLELGFTFQFPEIEPALRDLLNKPESITS